MKVLLVGNPAARGGEAAGWIPRAKRALIDAGATVDCMHTSAQGTATDVSNRCDRYTMVVALGGDGTVREVASGMVGRGVPLGLLPAGLANNHGASFGIPAAHDDLRRAIAILLGGTVQWMDAGCLSSDAGERLFFDTVGWGFQASVLHRRGQLRSQPGLAGEAGYVVAALLEAPRIQPFAAEVHQGTLHQYPRLTDLLVSASRWYAGRWVLDGSAQPDDGVFELIPVPSRRALLQEAWRCRGPRGGPQRPKAGSFELTFSRPMLSQIDGDPGPIGTSFAVHVRPRAVPVLRARHPMTPQPEAASD